MRTYPATMSEISSTFLSLALTACFLFPVVVAWRVYLRQRPKNSPPRGCRKLGIQTSSNLADEHSPQYSSAVPAHRGPNGEVVGKVKALFIYPIKSCARLEVAHGEVVKTGLEYDRQFTFAEWNAEKEGKGCWRFITQRTHPMLTQVQSELWIPDEDSPTYSASESSVRSQGVLIIRYPCSGGGFWAMMLSLFAFFGWKQPEPGTVHLPYCPTPEQIKENGYNLEELTIWKSHPTALLIASTNSLRPQRWIRNLQNTLKTSKPLALFRVAHGHARNPKGCAPSPKDLGYASVIGFADSYPLHILNLASVHALAGKQHPQAPRLSALQFRANVYFTGLEAYAEDDWKRVRVGDGEYYVTCRTTRCKLPNVNQDTGIVDEGVKALTDGVETAKNRLEMREAEPEAAMRKTRRIDAGAKLKACMGMMMVPAAENGSMKVGDEIEILATGEHFYVN
ncbi:MAG: hypothetical protein Q9175_001957 [Cornicularia normoerica]